MTGHRWRRTAGHTRYTGQGHAGQTQRFEDMYGRGALGWRSRHVHQHDMEKTKADASCLYMNICLSLYTATDRRTYSYRPAVSSLCSIETRRLRRALSFDLAIAPPLSMKHV